MGAQKDKQKSFVVSHKNKRGNRPDRVSSATDFTKMCLGFVLFIRGSMSIEYTLIRACEIKDIDRFIRYDIHKPSRTILMSFVKSEKGRAHNLPFPICDQMIEPVFRSIYDPNATSKRCTNDALTIWHSVIPVWKPDRKVLYRGKDNTYTRYESHNAICFPWHLN